MATTIMDLVPLLKARNEQRLALVRAEFEHDLDQLIGGNAGALDNLGRAWGANAALIERIRSWQELSERHHAVEYHQLAMDIEPFLRAFNPRVVGQRVVQTWFETVRGNFLRVTYKRHRPMASRIELKVGSGAPRYFGPADQMAIEAFLSPFERRKEMVGVLEAVTIELLTANAREGAVETERQAQIRDAMVRIMNLADEHFPQMEVPVLVAREISAAREQFNSYDPPHAEAVGLLREIARIAPGRGVTGDLRERLLDAVYGRGEDR